MPAEGTRPGEGNPAPASMMPLVMPAHRHGVSSHGRPLQCCGSSKLQGDAGQGPSASKMAHSTAGAWRPLVSPKTRGELWTLAILAGMATIPLAGLIPVAMANDADQGSPMFECGQMALLGYACGCTAIVGLPLAAVVIPTSLGAAALGETVGRIPLPRARLKLGPCRLGLWRGQARRSKR